MIYAVIVTVFVVLFIPFTLRVRIILNLKEFKIYYALTLYGVINLNCGYIGFANNRLILRYGKNKTLPLKYKDLLLDDSKVDLINHFDLLKSSSAILLGGENEELKLWTAFILRAINPVIYRLLCVESPNIKFKNDIFLLGEKDSSGGLLEVVAVSNAFALVELIIKKFIGEVTSYVKGKKG